ncbi:hypothetical protein GCM10009530_77270 [Microbispora corallina]
MHLACEQGLKPLSIVLTTGQRGDSPQFTAVIDGIRVPRLDTGRPRTRPDRVHGLSVWIPLVVSALNLTTALLGWATAHIRRSGQISNRPAIGESMTAEPTGHPTDPLPPRAAPPPARKAAQATRVLDSGRDHLP